MKIPGGPNVVKSGDPGDVGPPGPPGPPGPTLVMGYGGFGMFLVTQMMYRTPFCMFG